MPIDPYNGFQNTVQGSLSNTLKITPSVTEDLPVIPLRIYCEQGHYRFTFVNGETADISATIQPWNWFDFRVTRIEDLQAGTLNHTPRTVYIFW